MRDNGKPRKKSPQDELCAFLHAMPTNKKEAFMFLVRTKTRRDLQDMRIEAVKDDDEERTKLLEAAVSLRCFVEAGIPIHQL